LVNFCPKFLDLFSISYGNSIFISIIVRRLRLPILRLHRQGLWRLAGRQGQVHRVVQGVHSQARPRSVLLLRTSEAGRPAILLSDRSGSSPGFPIYPDPALFFEEIG